MTPSYPVTDRQLTYIRALIHDAGLSPAKLRDLIDDATTPKQTRLTETA